MKTIIIFFLMCSSAAVFSQDLSVTMEINKTEFSRYGRESDDSMIVTFKIKNNGYERVYFRLADGINEYYVGENGVHRDHCFRITPSGDYRDMYKPDYRRTPESFVWINPGEEITQTDSYGIGWLCRGMPPRGDWTFELSYERTITAEDNYYMFKSRYFDNYDKEPVEAWTGTLKSNNIEITIKH